MEFCPGGNLRKFLLNSRVNNAYESSTYINVSSTLTHRQLLKLAADVACGMVHLASFKVMHRYKENLEKNWHDILLASFVR